jgi:ribosomal protein L2
MNSVDHPHGGKANSVQPEKSPWGWITKKSH